MRLVSNLPLMIRKLFSMRVDYFQGEDGSYAVLTVMEHQLDADLNYYDPDILLHIENCGRGIVVGKLK